LTEEEETMWQTGVLGHSSSQSLNHTIFYQLASILVHEDAKNIIN